MGVQYYPHNELGGANDQHSAARMYGVMHNLFVAGLPIELTEFGIKADGVGTTAQNQQRSADILESSLRLTFGTPDATGFTMWGFWEGAVWSGAPDGVLYNSDWSARPAGTRWEDLMTFDNDGVDDDWTTNLTLLTGSDGSIDFTGFYGDYLITIDGTSYPLSLEKGTTSYTVNVPEPGAALLTLCALPLLRRRRHTRS